MAVRAGSMLPIDNSNIFIAIYYIYDNIYDNMYNVTMDKFIQSNSTQLNSTQQS